MEPTIDEDDFETDFGDRAPRGGFRYKPVIAVVALTALIGILVAWARSRGAASEDQNVVQEAALGSVRKVVSATGTIQSDQICAFPGADWNPRLSGFNACRR